MIKKGLKQFIARTAVFFGFLISLQLGIFLFLSNKPFFRKYLAVPEQFYFPILEGLNKQNFLSSAFFVVAAFLLWRWKDIKKFKAYKQERKETIIFSLLAFLSFSLHYLLKFLINRNLNVALSYSFLLTLLKYALNLLFIVFLAFAAYNKKFIYSFIKRYYKDIVGFTVLLFFYYRLMWWFQDSWLYFSSTVGVILKFVFSLMFDNVVFKVSNGAGPTLGVEGFYIGISKVCSGIESLLLFISLFIILVITNWKHLNKKRMLILFMVGLIGTYFMNILRVFLLVLIAVKLSPKFAVDVFHTNAGWIFFLVYFIVFWHFGRKWVLADA